MVKNAPAAVTLSRAIITSNHIFLEAYKLYCSTTSCFLCESHRVYQSSYVVVCCSLFLCSSAEAYAWQSMPFSVIKQLHYHYYHDIMQLKEPPHRSAAPTIAATRLLLHLMHITNCRNRGKFYSQPSRLDRKWR